MRTAHAAFSMTLLGSVDGTLLLLPAEPYASADDLSVTLDGAPLTTRIESGAHGTRQLRFSAGAGLLEVDARSTIHGRAAPFDDDRTSTIDGRAAPLDDGGAAPVDDGGAARYLEDSRYVEATALRGFVEERFGRASGFDAAAAMRRWIARGFTYSPAMSAIDDSAATTLGKRGGMCRDWAHVMIAFARAAGIPARYVSVYAPGLVPPDFHAVAELHIDGAWWVFDATGLAPRGSMVRIATGADAFETAWSTTGPGAARLETVAVRAADDALPADAVDDPDERVRLR